MSANEAPPSRCFACNQKSDARVYFEGGAWLCPACDEIFQQLRIRLGKTSQITPHTRIAQDQGCDSLVLTEILLDIFNDYKVPEDCMKEGTVGDISNYRIADIISCIRKSQGQAE